MTNFDLSLKVFDFLRQAQVGSIVVCAGARNAPLVMALKEQNFKVYSFFEERSASFFAIGLMRSELKPVAVLTTSGTAVAELLPATIEAAYQGLPLILVTADRPKNYRGTGSPQTIEQVGLFSQYVEATFDLDAHQDSFEFICSLKKPIHLNVCFDEPLIDIKSPESEKNKVFLQSINIQKIENDFSALADKPFVIIGGLDLADTEAVVNFVQRLKAPVYAEALSQIAHRSELQPYLIKSSDAIVKKAFQDKICNCVIRIGGVPTLRFWRDLENEFSEIPVAHFTNLSFSGLSRVAPLFSIEALSALKISSDYSVLHTVKSWDQDLQKRKLPLLAKYPLSEPSLVAEFSKVIAGHPLYLGNSLPIRHWDQFSAAASKSIYANRGANGIDGQISTYLGWSEGFQHSYCLVGDLTALYDLAALGLTPQLHPGQKRVVIINNFGGQIFGRIFKNDLFINAHKTQFKHWAAMFSWDYLIVKASEDLLQMKSDHLVVEIQPDENQTKLFWDEWDLLCRKA